MYKTKLCPFMNNPSGCQKGDQCSFAHSESELRPVVNLHKTKPCFDFSHGNCTRGAACPYAHGHAELRPNPNGQPQPMPKAKASHHPHVPMQPQTHMQPHVHTQPHVAMQPGVLPTGVSQSSVSVAPGTLRVLLPASGKAAHLSAANIRSHFLDTHGVSRFDIATDSNEHTTLVFLAEDNAYTRAMIAAHINGEENPPLALTIVEPAKGPVRLQFTVQSGPSNINPADVCVSLETYAKMTLGANVSSVKTETAGFIFVAANNTEAAKVLNKTIVRAGVTGTFNLATAAAAAPPPPAPAQKPVPPVHNPHVHNPPVHNPAPVAGGYGGFAPIPPVNPVPLTLPYDRIYVVHDVENCLMSKRAPLRDRDGKLMKVGGHVQFSDQPSDVDPSIIYTEVIRTALTPAIGLDRARSLDVQRDVSKMVLYYLVMKLNDASPYMPSNACVAGCNSLGMHVVYYDTSADDKIRQLLNQQMDGNSAQPLASRTLLVLISGDRDFSDVIKRAYQSGFDMAVIHGTDARVVSTFTTLLRLGRLMPDWTRIEAMARFSPPTANKKSLEPVPDGLIPKDPKCAGPEAVSVSKPVQHYLRMTAYRELDDLLSDIRPDIVHKDLYLAQPIGGGPQQMFVGATFEGGAPLDAQLCSEVRRAIEAYLKSIREKVIKLANVTRQDVLGDVALRTLARREGVALVVDGDSGEQEMEPLQDRHLFAQGPKSVLGSQQTAQEYCKAVLGVNILKTLRRPADQAGLPHGHARIRVHIAGFGPAYEKAKRACLAHNSDGVTFCDQSGLRSAPAPPATIGLGSLKPLWVFAVVDDKKVKKDKASVKEACENFKIGKMFDVKIEEEDQQYAYPGTFIARCKPDVAGAMDAKAAGEAAVEACLKQPTGPLAKAGIKFYRDSASVPVRATAAAGGAKPSAPVVEQVLVVTMVYRDRAAPRSASGRSRGPTGAELIEKELLKKVRVSAIVNIRPELVPLVTAALPVLRAEAESCDVTKFEAKLPDVAAYRKAVFSALRERKHAPAAQSGSLLLEGPTDAVEAAKRLLEQRLRVLPEDNTQHELGVRKTPIAIPKEWQAHPVFASLLSSALTRMLAPTKRDDDDDDTRSVKSGVSMGGVSAGGVTLGGNEKDQDLEDPVIHTVDFVNGAQRVTLWSLVPKDRFDAKEQYDRVMGVVGSAREFVNDFDEEPLLQSVVPGYRDFGSKTMHQKVAKDFGVRVEYKREGLGAPRAENDLDQNTVIAGVEKRAFRDYNAFKDFCENVIKVPIHYTKYVRDDQASAPHHVSRYRCTIRRAGMPPHEFAAARQRLLTFKGQGVLGWYESLAQMQGSGADARCPALLISGQKDSVAEAVEWIKQQDQILKPVNEVICADNPRVAWLLAMKLHADTRTKLVGNVIKNMAAAGVTNTSVSAFTAAQSGVKGEVLKLMGPAATMPKAADIARAEVKRFTDQLVEEVVRLDKLELHYLANEGKQMKEKNSEKFGVIISSNRDVIKKAKVPGAKAAGNKLLLTAKLGTVDVEVREGNMLSLNTAGIVNPANERLNHAGGAAKVIKDAAGGRDFDEVCQRALMNARGTAVVGVDGRVKIGSALVTESGRLSARGIHAVVHAVGPVYENKPGDVDLFVNTVASAYFAANEAGLTSLGIPLMGAGIYGWPAKEAARLTLLGLSKAVHALGSRNSVTKVVLVDMLTDRAAELADAMKAYAGATNNATASTLQEDLPRRAQYKPQFHWYWEKYETGQWFEYDYAEVCQIEQAIDSNNLPFTICGDTAGKFSDGKIAPGQTVPIYEVHKAADSKRSGGNRGRTDGLQYDFYQMNIAPPFFERPMKRTPFAPGDTMHGYHPDAPAPAAPARPVRVDNGLPLQYTEVRVAAGSLQPLSPSQPAAAAAGGAPTVGQEEQDAVVLLGLKVDVPKCRTALQTQIAKCWHQAECDLATTAGELWATVLSDVREKADANFAKVESEDEASRTVTLKALGQLQVMKAHKEVTALALLIAKRLLEIIPPSIWVDDDSEFSCHDVQKGTQEWADVEGRFRQGRSIPNEVTQIQRLQNPVAWANYYTKIKQIAYRPNPPKPGERDVFKRANEKWMFHGTGKTDPLVVAKHTRGLDYRFSGDYALFYGRAGYTAEDAAYSHSYRHTTADGKTGQMIVFRVAAGNMQEYRTRTEACKQIRMPDDGYDSVYGDVLGGMMAVMVYEPDMTYPAYLISYKL